MSINVIFFGQLAEYTGTESISYPLQIDTDCLLNKLMELYPSLSNVSYTVAVDKRVIKQNTILNIGATVALLPPFSGG